MSKQKKFLDNIPLDQALLRYHHALREAGVLAPQPAERIAVADALGRITAEAVIARISSPFYHSAAMDGFAVSFLTTFGASEVKPLRLIVPDQAVPIDTGDPMPPGYDAVVMIEDVERLSDREIEILKPATPWQHVRLVGEDIVATELILPENHAIRPVDMAAMIASGHAFVLVRKKPVVAVIPTGSELIQPGEMPGHGQIIDFNSTMLCAMALECGGLGIRQNIVPDDEKPIIEALVRAVGDSDMVLVNAGSSAGREDFTVHAVAQLGRVIVHGVAIKPGKPVILGIIEGKPVIGIPGYPVSAALTFSLFVKPLIRSMLGLSAVQPETITARLSRQVASTLGQEEFVRVKLGKVSENLVATPATRGAGALMSLVRADGIVRIPAASEGAGGGLDVSVELLRSPREIEQTIVCIGSHDNALDVLGNFLKKEDSAFSLSSAHVGSLGGLLALKRGEAHMAGTHLLDEETGEYNISAVKKMLPDTRIVLVNLVHRTQGLLVPKGNPKNIAGFHDLTRKDVVFVNRQAGAGTRLLTDLHLKRLTIDPINVKGYHHEEFTHMAVAAAVKSGAADTGLAVFSAAQALDLDFLPIAEERYDLAILASYYESPMLKALLRIVREHEGFRETLRSMGGYDLFETGKVLAVF